MSAFSPTLMATLGQLINAAPEAHDNTMDFGGEAQAPAPAQTTGQQLPLVRSVADAGVVAGTASTQAMAAGAKGARKADAALLGAAGADKEANAMQSEVQAAQGEAVAPLFEDHLQKLAMREADFSERMKVGQERATRAYDDYIRTSEDFGSSRVYSWWSQASTGAKVLGIISQTLSGALAGSVGNPGAPSPMDRIIEDDLARQKANIQVKGQAADNAGNLYRQLRQQLGDDVQAESAFRDIAYKAVQKRAEALIASMPAAARATAQANLLKLNAQTDMKVAESRANIQQHLSDQQMQASWKDAQMGLALAEGFGKSAASGAAAGATSGLAEVPGAEHLPEVDRRQLGQTLDNVNNLKNAAARMKATLQLIDSGKGDYTQLHGDLQQAVSDLDIAQNKVAELGALSGGDLAIIRGFSGVDPGIAGSLKNAVGIKTWKEAIGRIDRIIQNTDKRANVAVGKYTIPDPATGRRVRLQYVPQPQE